MKRNHFILIGVLLGLALPWSAQAADGEDAGSFASAMTSGKASFSARYRYEHVEDDDVDPDDPEFVPTKDADASTLRLRLNYRTGQWSGWSAFAEYDHVFHVLVDDFNSGGGTSPNRADHSAVVDPEGSDLNQFYLEYGGMEDWTFRFGRQRLALDNHRFIGTVGWRQNEQTYDGFSMKTTAISNTTLTYAYLSNVRRIFGQTVPAGKAKLDGHLLNAKISINENFSVTPYYYLLDYHTALGNSTATAGIRLAGSVGAGEGKIAWFGEFATQSDAGDNPASFDADYFRVDGMWTMDNGFGLGLGLESLGTDSSSGQSFRTPLATLHAMNGWADQFLGTPAAGLEDLYATVKFKLGNWNLTGVYHEFSSDVGSFDYGEEFDISAGTKFGKHYGLLLKGAFFSNDSESPLEKFDTNKFWLMLTAGF